MANWTPLPNAIPKSIPNTSPSVMSTRKLSKWRSPTPMRYDAIEKVAILLMNLFFMVMKAADVRHRFSSPLRSKFQRISLVVRLKPSVITSPSRLSMFTIYWMMLDWACPFLLTGKFFSHFIIAVYARDSPSVLPFSSLACSLLTKALIGSVLSTHSNEPRRLVIGVTEKVLR